MSLLSALPERLGGRYVVLSVLGTGGMADVYLAHDAELDRRVAVKVLRDASGTTRFRTEARTLARLRHPALVGVLDLGEVDGRPYLVLELVEGTSLSDRCRTGPLPPEEAARIGAEVAAALAYVHDQGVVHRDVSPGNVLLSDDGSVHLADFGVARLLEDHPTLTTAGETVGTVPYLAPEQVSGEAVTPAVDVYALGLVLLEALTCTRAFDGPPTEAALARLRRDPDLPASLPPGWRELLREMTRRDPRRRPTAAAVRDRLEGLTSATPVTRPLTLPHDLGITGGESPLVARLREGLSGAPGALARPWSFARRAPLAVWCALAVLLAVLLVATLPGEGRSPSPSPAPSGVPPAVADELQQLHEAVEGR